MWKSLAKRPVLVAIVHYATNEELIVSRFCSTSVVCISSTKQDEIDHHEEKADVAMQVHHDNIGLDDFGLCKEQFVTETDCIGEEFEDKWQQLLAKIQQFDKDYKRPKDFGYMSEKERLGDFSGIHISFPLH